VYSEYTVIVSGIFVSMYNYALEWFVGRDLMFAVWNWLFDLINKTFDVYLSVVCLFVRLYFVWIDSFSYRKL
jgi:hypothetical protein